MATDPVPDHDAISSRISPTCPADTQQLLTASWSHDLAALKRLLALPGRASNSSSCRDPQTGETPLHAAIRSCGPRLEAGQDDDDDEAKARTTVHELFLSGAIWNDVDDRDETPGCVALRLGRTALYDLCVEAGARAEMLFGLLGGYEELESGSDEEMGNGGDDAEVEVENENGLGTVAELDDDNGEEAPQLVEADDATAAVAQEGAEFVSPPKGDEGGVTSEEYLRSRLTYSDGKLVDDERNGVMMAWETDIMRRSVDALLPGRQPGKRILNIGLGMGIIDAMFAETAPARHHIIEAHPEVLEHLSGPDAEFGARWESGAPAPGAYKVHHGRWQDVCPRLLREGEVYDAIYFDTFGEDYGQLRKFFTEYVVGLLEQDGVFGFFNGLGADRRICYDVYTKVVEMHLVDAGLDVDWQVVDVDLKGLEEAGKGEWEGVRRRYWTLDKYRLPVCTFLG
ncbi:protein arginine N-methyltransferase 2 [Phialemonium atrogriseum]|uniref:Arginine N-methyltransferase 2 n=1 Tax=Phialemonium atrogriseum TaxID=1093897 RepID=A0AAJ0FN10_9PEZI|nr:protein arginine N-methyltransferase 2 [Phialemonium atrogriseum]KAK1768449.1 protein arginine N-methyltransferase 2 [Phialemonium atrogriseum]